jgi:MFS superfamily sulfate permease-like transporter
MQLLQLRRRRQVNPHFRPRQQTAKERVQHYLPITRWLPQYNIARDLKNDVVAGITVAMMLIPQEISLANIMNVPAHHGLYTAATAPLIYALFGSSTVLSVASGSEVSLLVGTILEDIEDEDERVATGVFYAFMAGVILLLVRIFNLSQLAEFFSRPVMGGFVSAGGLLIALAQVPSWLGITIDSSTYTVMTIYRIFSKIGKTNLNALFLGLGSMVFLQALRIAKKRYFPTRAASVLFQPENKLDAVEEGTGNTHEQTYTAVPAQPSAGSNLGFSLTDHQYVSYEAHRAAEAASVSPVDDEKYAVNAASTTVSTPKSPVMRVLIFIVRTFCDIGPLVVCVVGAGVGYSLGKDSIKLTGTIPGGFPDPKWPWYGYNEGIIHTGFGTILYRAVTIVVVVFLSSIAMAKRLAIQRGENINTSQELTGLSAAAIVAGFFQAMPPTGGMSRTAVNFQNARTQLASIITCLIIILALYTLTSVMYYLPKATLASIIIVAGFSLVEFHEAKWLYKVNRIEFWVWTLSFLLTLMLGVLDGLIGSIIVSVLALMLKARTAPIVVLGQLDNGSLVDRDQFVDATPLGDVIAIRIETSIMFANAERIAQLMDEEIARVLHEDDVERVAGVVLDMQHVNEIDATTVQVISDEQEKLAVHGIKLAIANARGRVHDVIAATNLAKRLVAGNPCLSLDEAVSLLRLEDGAGSVEDGATGSSSNDDSAM